MLFIIALEVYGIWYTVQFKSRLIFLLPWAFAVILTVYLFIQFDFMYYAHAAEQELLNYFRVLFGG